MTTLNSTNEACTLVIFRTTAKVSQSTAITDAIVTRAVLAAAKLLVKVT